MCWEAFPVLLWLDTIWAFSLSPAFLPLTPWCYPAPLCQVPLKAAISSPDRQQEGEKAAGQPLLWEHQRIINKGGMTGCVQEILIKWERMRREREMPCEAHLPLTTHTTPPLSPTYVCWGVKGSPATAGPSTHLHTSVFFQVENWYNTMSSLLVKW